MSFSSFSNSQVKAGVSNPGDSNYGVATEQYHGPSSGGVGAQEGNLHSTDFVYTTQQMQQPGKLLSHSVDTMTGIFGARNSRMPANPLHPEGISGGDENR